MKTCVGYIRVSSEDQVKGFSLDAQNDAVKKLAKAHELKLLTVYKDEGQSAREKDRPEFQKMITRCEQEHIDYVLVYHTDRFARNSLDHAMIKDKLRKANTALLSYSQPMIDNSPEGKFLDGVLASVNQFYSDDLSRKTIMGLQRKWEEGWWPGWAPIGYTNIPQVRGGDKGRVEIDPVQGPLVVEAFKLYATGNYSLIKLTQTMFDKGLKSRKKRQILTDSSIQQMLANPFYYGLMRWNGETKIGNHTPLVTKSLFDQCQYIAAQHRQFLIRNRKHKFLLRGFVYCPFHERRLTAEWHEVKSKQRNKVGYYHCCNTGGCRSTYIQSDKLEEMVAKLVSRYEFSETFINIVKEQMRKRLQESKGTVNTQKQALTNKRSGIEQKRNSLEDKLIDGLIDRETYKRQHDRLENDIIQIDNQISSVEGQEKLDMNLIEEVLGLTRNLAQSYQDAPFNLKRQYLRLFFEKIYISRTRK